MESQCRCRFLILDLGHPMNNNSVNNIITSMENILPLALSFSPNARGITLGISILNSDFAVFESGSHFLRNYDLIAKNLKSSLKRAKSNKRVTVQEYKQLLSSSIEAVLHEFQKYTKKNSLSSQLANLVIQIAVVTKKTASLLADILKDVTSKLQKNFPNIPSVKNYKIVQILNKEDNSPASFDKNLLIDSTFCLDNTYNLNCFFKEWLLNKQQGLKILLSKELNLEVHCFVDDCIVNPLSIILDGSDISYKASRRQFLLGVVKPSEVEIINRFPACGFCPTFVFGTPRRITAAQSCDNCAESQINSKMFKQLCRELYQKGEGLLAKSAPSAQLNSFHLLTSDGNMLLMNDVAAEELCLPTRERIPKSVHSYEDETAAASVMRACFEKIKHLDEYNPKHYSSGIYDYLRNYLAQTGEKKSLFGHLDSNIKSLGTKTDNKDQTKPASDTTDNSNENPLSSTNAENRKKRQKIGCEMELENVHPALLSPNVVEKYRKIDSQAFNLPELSRDYNESLM